MKSRCSFYSRWSTCLPAHSHSLNNQHDFRGWLLTRMAALQHLAPFCSKAPSSDTRCEGAVGPALSCFIFPGWMRWAISILYWLTLLLPTVVSLFRCFNGTHSPLAMQDGFLRAFCGGENRSLESLDGLLKVTQQAQDKITASTWVPSLQGIGGESICTLCSCCSCSGQVCAVKPSTELPVLA